MYNLSFHEKKQHGTVDFPAEYYYVDKDHPQYHMAFHWHKEWEIIRILQGEFTLHADEEEYLAHAGDVFLLRDGMLHGGTPKDCVYECFVFDLHGLFRDVNSVKKYLRPIYRNQVLPWVYFPCGQAGRQETEGEEKKPDKSTCGETDLYEIVDELMRGFSAGKKKGTGDPTGSFTDRLPGDPLDGSLRHPCELTALGNLSRLFALILEKGYLLQEEGNSPSSSRKVSQLKTVLEYIENHFAEKIILDDLASVAGMSPKYFCRFFRSVTHQTPMDYVNYYRIERAASLLCSADFPITVVGMECGFNDSSYFVKAFKKYMGMTPKQYRRANG